ncbi:MAG: RdgB/HAM1 family non-canonical purine NTP pyrophosphatase [Planctomycetes bacterium]|nr:RdgB/HAM1 family non-canonical purine NTP pyrophosphatase [Planctomycetota bacterium]MCB9890890.1 RdgB/HAM1 family non-canonical purine NTP pyrophosphatase [Planctomycetota bacterium]
MSHTLELLVASGNTKKKRELDQLLAGFDVRVELGSERGAMPEVIEDQPTFEGNAMKKAREWAIAFRSWTLADDSGLVVDALDGEPGVHSARYALDRVGARPTDDQNNAKLLDELRDVADRDRTARFVCALALADPHGRIRILTTGTAEGRILHERRGECGFGYDPLFLHECGQTFAELSSEAKANVSHRGEAMALFCGALSTLLSRRTGGQASS